MDWNKTHSSHRLRNATIRTGFHETKTRAQKSVIHLRTKNAVVYKTMESKISQTGGVMMAIDGQLKQFNYFVFSE